MNRRQFLLSTAALPLATTATQAAEAKTYRIAVIGHTGRGNYGHGLDTVWLGLPNTPVVAVSDPDPKGLKAASERLPDAKTFPDHRTMLKEIKPDIVAIGPRHVDQHLQHTLDAIEHGARGIYMEKPFCRSPQEADQIIAACEQSGTKLALAHRNRYHPALPVAKNLIAEGLIGTLLEARARGKEDTRGGSLDLWVLGSHLFNLATYFMGAPRSCSASVTQDGTPVSREHVAEGAEGISHLAGNAVHARFEMSNGLPLYFDSMVNAGDKAAGFGLQFIGTEGVIDLRIDQEPLIHLRPGNPFNPKLPPQPWQAITTAGPGQPEPIPGLGKELSSHRSAVRDLIESIENDRAPLCDPAAGLETMEMICAVFESHRHQGRHSPFPLETRVNPLSQL
jgi:predicted dehydrogenase